MASKKISKSVGKFAKAYRAKNLVEPARRMTDTQSVDTSPTAKAIRTIADADTDTAIADYAQRSTEQAGVDFAALPNPNAIDPDLGARLRPIATGDALSNLAASPALEAQMRAASSQMNPRVVSHEQACNSVASAMVNEAFAPRHR